MRAEKEEEGEVRKEEEKFGIRIIDRHPSQSRLAELGIRSWPKWGCPPGKFALKYDAEETCYIVKGKELGFRNLLNRRLPVLTGYLYTKGLVDNHSAIILIPPLLGHSVEVLCYSARDLWFSVGWP